MTIYLYKKTHNITGLKYLGKTTRDPFKYQGSGKYWSRHIAKHGNDVTTEILHECSSENELEEMGLYYSHLWNIVEDDGWANLKPEEGDGFGSEEMRLRWTDPEYRSKKTSELREMWNSPEFRERMSEIHKEIWQDPEYQSLITQRRKEMWEDPDYQKLKSQQATEFWENPEYRRKQSESRKEVWENDDYRKAAAERTAKAWENPEYRAAVILKHSGKNNCGYDHKIYHFVNDDGTEEKCTRHELYTKHSLDANKITLLVKGTRKMHKGWRIINTE